MNKLPISAIVLTYNEQPNIVDCLTSIINHADQILIIDSFSNDDTLEIATKYNVSIYQNKFIIT